MKNLFLPDHKALCFAARAHEGQHRKGGKTPYIVHPIGVAELVKRYTHDQKMIDAAYLHDVIEDCDVTFNDLVNNFDLATASLVQELTNIYTKEAHPNLNRKQRKEHENVRLAHISHKAKVIKGCDIWYNIHDMKGLKESDRMLQEKKDTVIAMFSDIDWGWPDSLFSIRRDLFDFFGIKDK